MYEPTSTSCLLNWNKNTFHCVSSCKIIEAKKDFDYDYDHNHKTEQWWPQKTETRELNRVMEFYFYWIQTFTKIWKVGPEGDTSNWMKQDKINYTDFSDNS